MNPALRSHRAANVALFTLHVLTCNRYCHALSVSSVFTPSPSRRIQSSNASSGTSLTHMIVVSCCYLGRTRMAVAGVDNKADEQAVPKHRPQRSQPAQPVLDGDKTPCLLQLCYKQEERSICVKILAASYPPAHVPPQVHCVFTLSLSLFHASLSSNVVACVIALHVSSTMHVHCFSTNGVASDATEGHLVFSFSNVCRC